MAAEPALYVAPSEMRGSLRHMGEGDCVDEAGRRLQGLQKLGRAARSDLSTHIDLIVFICIYLKKSIENDGVSSLFRFVSLFII